MRIRHDTLPLGIAIGLAIDAEDKKTGPYSTVDIALCLARLAASAGAICNPSSPPVGVEIVYHEFLNELEIQCQKHKIEVYVEKQLNE